MPQSAARAPLVLFLDDDEMAGAEIVHFVIQPSLNLACDSDGKAGDEHIIGSLVPNLANLWPLAPMLIYFERTRKGGVV
ncbi:unnamed protein product [Clonostachys chloroleuca]|uniref:Uncharacterized protein n=1 Tax=Clonostachys chloroleuca TaxID=1926264 RepID=A0AA35MHI2_9HYPO|nr:unnamed protein product [Clonostachys chloroleuca]